MATIGVLAASSNSTFNLDSLPQFILIGAPDTDIPVTNLSVVSAGQQIISLTSAANIIAFAKYQQGAMLGADVKVPMGITVADGMINKGTTINMLNGGVTTPAVYAVSNQKGSIARQAVETSINASANATYQGFEALFFNPTNVLRAQITFSSGFSDEFSVPELDAYFAKTNICDADGRLNGLTVISGMGVQRVTLFNGSGGATTVVISQFLQL